MKLRFFSLFYLLFYICMLPAQDSLSIQNRLMDYASLTGDFTKQVYENPAMNFYRRAYSVTSIFVSGSSENKDKALLLQDGDKWKGGTFQADSYFKLTGDSRVWGTAYYTNGRKSNVQWSETSDYELVYPYVMADTIGGFLKSETYFFSGGYAAKHKQFTWGASLSYRAAMEYRNVDPRPQNVVADLKAKIGGGLNFRKYIIGVSLHACKYKQTSDIKFLNELGVSKVFHLTGLGMDYVRFSGNNNSIYYKEKTLGGSLNIFPANKRGVSASVSYDNFSFEKILVNLNRLPLNYLSEDVFLGEFSWIHYREELKKGIQLSLEHRNRKGTENLFGDASGNIYPQIGKARMFENLITTVQLSAVYERRIRSVFQWSIKPYIGYQSIESNYLSPLRSLNVKNANGGFQVNTLYQQNKYVFQLIAGGTHRQNIDSEMLLTDIKPEEAVLGMLDHNYNYLSSAETSMNLTFRYDWNIIPGGRSVFLETTWRHGWHINKIKSNTYYISLGIML